MEGASFLFYIILALLFYTYLGYPLLIGVCLVLQRILKKKPEVPLPRFTEPELTLIVPCFNEAALLEKKIANCLSLDYPAEKIHFLFITDGSTDQSAKILSRHPQIQHLHQAERRGKTSALNRAMQFVHTPFTVFTDANTLLNSQAIRLLLRHFTAEKTGCVSGEKRITHTGTADAGDAGEAFYWKYESRMKQLDAGFYSVMGALGELMAIRTSLFAPLPENCLLDDFTQSMQIAAAGYRIAYEPGAYAQEPASANIEEEWKRKLRIATGNWQALFHLRRRLSWKRTPALCFQYLAQRWLKRAIAPFLLPLLLLAGGLLTLYSKEKCFFFFFLLQVIFYLWAGAGHVLRKKQTRFPVLFAPYYFCLVQFAAMAGWMRYRKGVATGIWEKSARK